MASFIIIMSTEPTSIVPSFPSRLLVSIQWFRLILHNCMVPSHPSYDCPPVDENEAFFLSYLVNIDHLRRSMFLCLPVGVVKEKLMPGPASWPDWEAAPFVMPPRR